MNFLKSILARTIAVMAVAVPVCSSSATAGYLGDVNPQFRHITTRQGLPSNCVRDLCQDSVGYIWMATDGGLLRYDGTHLKPYVLEADDSTAAAVAGSGDPERFVMALATRGPALYAATDLHVFGYDRASDRFRYMPLDAPAGQKAHGLVRSMAVDAKGQLWVSVAQGGVWRFDADGSASHRYTFPDLSTFNGTVMVDSSDRVWVTTNSATGTLYQYIPSADHFEAFDLFLPDGTKAPTASMAMAESPSGALWLALWNGDMLRFNPTTRRAWLAGPTEAYHPHSLHVEVTDAGERLIIGSDAGLTVLTAATPGSSEPFASMTLVPDELDPNSLSNRFVYAVLRDREGGYWISTFHGGVNYLPPPLAPVQGLRYSRYRNSVQGTQVAALAPTPEGDIYFGTEDGGVTFYCRSTGTFTPIASTRGAHPFDVHALLVDGPNLWIGTTPAAWCVWTAPRRP